MTLKNILISIMFVSIIVIFFTLNVHVMNVEILKATVKFCVPFMIEGTEQVETRLSFTDILSAQISLVRAAQDKVVKLNIKSNDLRPDNKIPEENKNSIVAQNIESQNTENIKNLDMSREVRENYDDMVKNHTDKVLNIKSLIESDLDIKNPRVLIVHTHSSEAYTPTEKDFYVPTDPDRTEDKNFNINKVGAELKKELEKRGVEVIHDTTVHDYPSYNSSYSNALKTIERNLKKYPDIQIVLDVHRDGITTSDGSKIAVSTEIENEKVAQVMLVVGSDENLEHPYYEENLKFALKLENELLKYKGLTRTIDFRSERFNQHKTKGSIIIEVGSNGNTLQEALASCKYMAEGISVLINNL